MTQSKAGRKSRKNPRPTLIATTDIVESLRRKKIAEKKARSAGTAVPNIQAKPSSGRKVDVMVGDLTPDFAQELLDRTPHNQRKIRESGVKRYAADMLQGNWRISGDPIKLSKDFELWDGQHRCRACALSGVTLKDQVFEILYEEEAYLGMDQNILRNAGDMERFEGSKPTPAALASAILFEHNGFRPRRCSLNEKMQILRGFNPDLKEKSAQLLKGRPYAGCLAAAIGAMRVAPEEGFDFFNAAFNNRHYLYGSDNHYIRLLATWMLRTRADQHRTKTGEPFKRECAYRALQAWNAYRQGRPLVKLQYKNTYEMPEPL